MRILLSAYIIGMLVLGACGSSMHATTAPRPVTKTVTKIVTCAPLIRATNRVAIASVAELVADHRLLRTYGYGKNITGTHTLDLRALRLLKHTYKGCS